MAASRVSANRKRSRVPKSPVRLPQRSEAVAGNEAKVTTPIAAAVKKKPLPRRRRSGPTK